MGELAEVQMFYFDTGKPVPEGFSEDSELAVIILEDKISPYPTTSGMNQVYIDDLFTDYGTPQTITREYLSGQESTPETVYAFKYPVAFFTFRFFGESYDYEYAGGAEWDMHEGVGVGEWFSEEADDLVRTGRMLLDQQKNPKDHWDGSRFARWVVELRFSGGVDSWSGEYDCTSEYVGHVDLSKLQLVT